MFWWPSFLLVIFTIGAFINILFVNKNNKSKKTKKSDVRNVWK